MIIKRNYSLFNKPNFQLKFNYMNFYVNWFSNLMKKRRMKMNKHKVFFYYFKQYKKLQKRLGNKKK